MSKQPRAVYATDDGRRTHAPPSEAHRTLKGDTYVWIRTQNGDITRAFATGEVV